MGKATDEAVKALEKKYGKGVIINEDSVDKTIERSSSGSIALDIALGGGYPKGRIIEIYGPESSGKSTLALHAIAEIQKEGGVAAYIDAEQAFDFVYANNLGVDTSSNAFLFSQPDDGEQALEVVETLIKTKEVAIVVIDSVAALTPKAEIEGEMGENKMGLHARLMSQALRKLVKVVNTTNTIVIFINQLRDKIGVMFGSPETTTGGNALKFYSSIRIDVRRIGQEKDGENVITGSKTRAKIIKNKTFPPFKQAEFVINFGEGIDSVQEIIDIGVNLNIINKSGSWYSYGDTKIGQGNETVKVMMNDNPELLDEVIKKIKAKL
jgi:recombination protein RecA